MFKDIREHLDIAVWVIGSLVVYHYLLKMSGHPDGLFGAKRWL